MEASDDRFDERDRARFDGNRAALDAAAGWRSGESVLRVERAAAKSFGMDAAPVYLLKPAPHSIADVAARRCALHCGHYESSQTGQGNGRDCRCVLRYGREEIPAEGF